MNDPTKRFYGLKDQERLDESVKTCVERLLADGFTGWPIKVYVHQQMDVGGEFMAASIAEHAIERALDNLDEEYGDPDGDPTEPTEAMKAAALAFGRAVVADYVPFMCEETGEVIEVTREAAMEMMGEAVS
jgi:hypothetical protein